MGGWQTTRSGLVAMAVGITAGVSITAGARAALTELCRSYWPPVYTFVRRSGYGHEDAKDLVQGFFTRILERNDLAGFDRRRGRFRNWLLAVLQNFLANEWRNARRLKRGGEAIVLPIEACDAEEQSVCELSALANPERLYERRWAVAVLERAMHRLEQEHADGNRRARFERLRGFLIGDEPSYRALAEESGEAEGSLRQQVKRLRDRYRDLVRSEIRRTVPRSSDVQSELQDLYAALS